MPTLDPIVVNPPKEKKTYTFSDNDIKDISREVAQQEIAKAKQEGEFDDGIVANPQLEGTESALTGLKVNGVKYKVADPESAPSGTITNVLGLDSEGKLVKGTISGGTKLYQHELSFKSGTSNIFSLTLFGTTGTAITFENAYGSKGINYGGSIISLLNKVIFVGSPPYSYSYFYPTAVHSGPPTSNHYGISSLSIDTSTGAVATADILNITGAVIDSVNDVVTEL